MMKSAIRRQTLRYYACKSTFDRSGAVQADQPVVCPHCGVPQKSANRLKMQENVDELREAIDQPGQRNDSGSIPDQTLSSISEIRVDAGHTEVEVTGSAASLTAADLEDELTLSPAVAVTSNLSEPGGNGSSAPANVMEELEQLASVEELNPLRHPTSQRPPTQRPA